MKSKLYVCVIVHFFWHKNFLTSFSAVETFIATQATQLPIYSRTTQRVNLISISHSLAISGIMISWYLIEDGGKVRHPEKDGVSSHLHRFKNHIESQFENIKITLLKHQQSKERLT